MKNLSTGSNAAIAGALAGVQARIMEDLDGYQATPDQAEWRGRVDLHFQRIYQVLAGIGTPETLNAAEWESSRNWASVYIVLFMAIDALFCPMVRSWPVEWFTACETVPGLTALERRYRRFLPAKFQGPGIVS